MPFKYACFISYRNIASSPIYNQRVREIYKNLKEEISQHLDITPVYLDEERLKPGDFITSDIATDLCQSVCMVMIYIPKYFSVEKLFCSREYRAMQNLEERRLEILGQHGNKKKYGLIFPIILRGKEDFPQIIQREERVTIFMDDISTDDIDKSEIRRIAQAVKDRYDIFDSINVDWCSDCETFGLPTEAEVKPWVETIINDKRKQTREKHNLLFPNL